MIKVVIRRSELKAAGACPEGLKWFEAVATRGVLRVVWDVPTQVRFVIDAKDWIRWAIGKNICPVVNLYCANLESANLYRANLYRANLYRANLYRANLYRANLESANLESANLKGAIHNEFTRMPEGWVWS